MTTKKTNDDLGSDEVQKTVDAETKQGFSGSVPDPTPNENYTVSGVTAGKPTPETSAPETSKTKK